MAVRHLVTGGAGFIAVNLIRRLLASGDRVVAIDDLSTGRRETLAEFETDGAFSFIQADCSDAARMAEAIGQAGGADEIWHLAANSDIPAGVSDPTIDLRRTFLTTFGVLAAMRDQGVPVLHFASSSAIYGDQGEALIHEDIGPLMPISNYGAMKLASEAQISAAAEAGLGRINILRFPNVIGAPATHGVILDFVRKLKATPDRLEVLGDGTQQKAYLHVEDLVSAMLHIRTLEGARQVFNIGPADDGVTVRFIAETVRDRVSPGAEIAFGEGNRGWVGDVPRFRYSIDRLAATGWRAALPSQAAVTRAVEEIIAQEAS
ncbi:MAG: NAD-dependent epimerase/dehydratase family protein [Brevundimonas sp.]|uniref:NAD-dependent epimerase/dehydratase family protein n=1 Tax=Brevundimonas sp. TaxID=1871086 RepID=UPI0040332857